MLSFELIQAYMKAKNYTQAKQAAIDLGYSDAFLADSELSSKMQEIAEASVLKTA